MSRRLRGHGNGVEHHGIQKRRRLLHDNTYADESLLQYRKSGNWWKVLDQGDDTTVTRLLRNEEGNFSSRSSESINSIRRSSAGMECDSTSSRVTSGSGFSCSLVDNTEYPSGSVRVRPKHRRQARVSPSDFNVALSRETTIAQEPSMYACVDSNKSSFIADLSNDGDADSGSEENRNLSRNANRVKYGRIRRDRLVKKRNEKNEFETVLNDITVNDSQNKMESSLPDINDEDVTDERLDEVSHLISNETRYGAPSALTYCRQIVTQAGRVEGTTYITISEVKEKVLLQGRSCPRERRKAILPNAFSEAMTEFSFENNVEVVEYADSTMKTTRSQVDNAEKLDKNNGEPYDIQICSQSQNNFNSEGYSYVEDVTEELNRSGPRLSESNVIDEVEMYRLKNQRRQRRRERMAISGNVYAEVLDDNSMIDSESKYLSGTGINAPKNANASIFHEKSHKIHKAKNTDNIDRVDVEESAHVSYLMKSKEDVVESVQPNESERASSGLVLSKLSSNETVGSDSKSRFVSETNITDEVDSFPGEIERPRRKRNRFKPIAKNAFDVALGNDSLTESLSLVSSAVEVSNGSKEGLMSLISNHASSEIANKNENHLIKKNIEQNVAKELPQTEIGKCSSRIEDLNAQNQQSHISSLASLPSGSCLSGIDDDKEFHCKRKKKRIVLLPIPQDAFAQALDSDSQSDSESSIEDCAGTINSGTISKPVPELPERFEKDGVVVSDGNLDLRAQPSKDETLPRNNSAIVDVKESENDELKINKQQILESSLQGLNTSPNKSQPENLVEDSPSICKSSVRASNGIAESTRGFLGIREKSPYALFLQHFGDVSSIMSDTVGGNDSESSKSDNALTDSKSKNLVDLPNSKKSVLELDNEVEDLRLKSPFATADNFVVLEHIESFTSKEPKERLQSSQKFANSDLKSLIYEMKPHEIQIDPSKELWRSEVDSNQVSSLIVETEIAESGLSEMSEFEILAPQPEKVSEFKLPVASTSKFQSEISELKVDSTNKIDGDIDVPKKDSEQNISGFRVSNYDDTIDNEAMGSNEGVAKISLTVQENKKIEAKPCEKAAISESIAEKVVTLQEPVVDVGIKAVESTSLDDEINAELSVSELGEPKSILAELQAVIEPTAAEVVVEKIMDKDSVCKSLSSNLKLGTFQNDLMAGIDAQDLPASLEASDEKADIFTKVIENVTDQPPVKMGTESPPVKGETVCEPVVNQLPQNSKAIVNTSASMNVSTTQDLVPEAFATLACSEIKVCAISPTDPLLAELVVPNVVSELTVASNVVSELAVASLSEVSLPSVKPSAEEPVIPMSFVAEVDTAERSKLGDPSKKLHQASACEISSEKLSNSLATVNELTLVNSNIILQSAAPHTLFKPCVDDKPDNDLSSTTSIKEITVVASNPPILPVASEAVSELSDDDKVNPATMIALETSSSSCVKSSLPKLPLTSKPLSEEMVLDKEVSQQLRISHSFKDQAFTISTVTETSASAQPEYVQSVDDKLPRALPATKEAELFAQNVPVMSASPQPFPEEPVEDETNDKLQSALPATKEAELFAQNVPVMSASPQPFPEEPVEDETNDKLQSALPATKEAELFAQNVPVMSTSPQPFSEESVEDETNDKLQSALPATKEAELFAQNVPVMSTSPQPFSEESVEDETNDKLQSALPATKEAEFVVPYVTVLSPPQTVSKASVDDKASSEPSCASKEIDGSSHVKSLGSELHSTSHPAPKLHGDENHDAATQNASPAVKESDVSELSTTPQPVTVPSPISASATINELTFIKSSAPGMTSTPLPVSVSFDDNACVSVLSGISDLTFVKSNARDFLSTPQRLFEPLANEKASTEPHSALSMINELTFVKSNVCDLPTIPEQVSETSVDRAGSKLKCVSPASNALVLLSDPQGTSTSSPDNQPNAESSAINDLASVKSSVSALPAISPSFSERSIVAKADSELTSPSHGIKELTFTISTFPVTPFTSQSVSKQLIVDNADASLFSASKPINELTFVKSVAEILPLTSKGDSKQLCRDAAGDKQVVNELNLINPEMPFNMSKDPVPPKPAVSEFDISNSKPVLSDQSSEARGSMKQTKLSQEKAARDSNSDKCADTKQVLGLTTEGTFIVSKPIARKSSNATIGNLRQFDSTIDSEFLQLSPLNIDLLNTSLCTSSINSIVPHPNFPLATESEVPDESDGSNGSCNTREISSEGSSSVREPEVGSFRPSYRRESEVSSMRPSSTDLDVGSFRPSYAIESEVSSSRLSSAKELNVGSFRPSYAMESDISSMRPSIARESGISSVTSSSAKESDADSVRPSSVRMSDYSSVRSSTAREESEDSLSTSMKKSYKHFSTPSAAEKKAVDDMLERLDAMVAERKRQDAAVVQKIFPKVNALTKQNPRSRNLCKPKPRERKEYGAGEENCPMKKRKLPPWVGKELRALVEEAMEEREMCFADVEEFLFEFADTVKRVMKSKRGLEVKEGVKKVQEQLSELKIIKSLSDFYEFVRNYLPFEFRRRSIPCTGNNEEVHPQWVEGTQLDKTLF